MTKVMLVSQQKKLIKIVVYGDTNMAAMMSSANALFDKKPKDSFEYKTVKVNFSCS